MQRRLERKIRSGCSGCRRSLTDMGLFAHLCARPFRLFPGPLVAGKRLSVAAIEHESSSGFCGVGSVVVVVVVVAVAAALLVVVVVVVVVVPWTGSYRSRWKGLIPS